MKIFLIALALASTMSLHLGSFRHNSLPAPRSTLEASSVQSYSQDHSSDGRNRPELSSSYSGQATKGANHYSSLRSHQKTQLNPKNKEIDHEQNIDPIVAASSTRTSVFEQAPDSTAPIPVDPNSQAVFVSPTPVKPNGPRYGTQSPPTSISPTAVNPQLPYSTAPYSANVAPVTVSPTTTVPPIASAPRPPVYVNPTPVNVEVKIAPVGEQIPLPEPIGVRPSAKIYGTVEEDKPYNFKPIPVITNQNVQIDPTVIPMGIADSVYGPATGLSSSQCPYNTVLNQTSKRCQPISSQCEKGKYFNTTLNECRFGEELCHPITQYFDPYSLICTPKYPQCRSDETLDQHSNKCILISSTCSPRQAYSQDKNLCLQKCTADQIFNETTTQCDEISSTCTRFQIYSRGQHRCIEKSESCGEDYFYSKEKETCVSNEFKCTQPNTFYSQTEKKCVLIYKKCTIDEYLDPLTNLCKLKEFECSKHQFYNWGAHECQHRSILCLKTQQYDESTLLCVNKQ